MKITILFFVVLVSLISSDVTSQTVAVNPERSIQQMRDKYINRNKADGEFNGWRIQFYSTTDRRNMENTLKRLKSAYPSVKFTWVYDTPYYRLRAGAFRYRSDLLPLQFELKKEFPGAFPIEDKIVPKKLSKNF